MDSQFANLLGSVFGTKHGEWYRKQSKNYFLMASLFLDTRFQAQNEQGLRAAAYDLSMVMNYISPSKIGKMEIFASLEAEIDFLKLPNKDSFLKMRETSKVKSEAISNAAASIL
jgi:hypothetical protein